MKESKLISLGLVLCTMMFACKKDNTEPAGKTQDPPPPSAPVEVSLVAHEAITLGWGSGRVNNDGYLTISLDSGGIRSYRNVDPTDRATQELTDLIFPGDNGSSGGQLLIAAPASSFATGTPSKPGFCDEWMVRKGTQLTDLPGSFDLRSFENMKYLSQLKALHKEEELYYSDWVTMLDAKPGRSFLIKTEAGVLAIAYIESVSGTYGSETARLVLRLKVQP